MKLFFECDDELYLWLCTFLVVHSIVDRPNRVKSINSCNEGVAFTGMDDPHINSIHFRNPKCSTHSIAYLFVTNS